MFEVREKVFFCRKHPTKLLKQNGQCWASSHVAGCLPRVFASWQGGRPTSVFLCFNFPSDLNCQSHSIFVPFVKMPLFSLFPVVVSSLLLKKKSQSCCGSMEAGLTGCAVWHVAPSQSHLRCSQTVEITSCQITRAPSWAYNSQRSFCHQLFCVKAMTYWMVGSYNRAHSLSR